MFSHCTQEWLDYINPRVLGTVDAAKSGTPILPPGSPLEMEPSMKKRFAAMLERAEALAKAADAAGVTIMFDAEQSELEGLPPPTSRNAPPPLHASRFILRSIHAACH
jgi:hypothetical protein